MVVKWREKREREFITLLPSKREARKTMVGLRCANFGVDKKSASSSKLYGLDRGFMARDYDLTEVL